MKSKRLGGLIAIVAGPLVVAWLYMFVLKCPDRPRDYFMIVKAILVAAVATLAVSYATHRLVRQLRRATFVSTVVAEMLYLLGFLVVGTLHKSWFPSIVAVIMTVTALPMAILISYGTGRLLRTPMKTDEVSTH